MSLRAAFFMPLQIFAKVFIVVLSLIVIMALLSLAFVGVGQNSAQLNEIDSKYSYLSGERSSEDKLLLIPIQGIILGMQHDDFASSGFMSQLFTYGYAIQRQLKEAAEDEEIKGILLHIQTPGGTIFGSQAIAKGIDDYQEATGKPVFAYIEGLSASGGVMAMVAADAIYADHGSMIGSIGVIGPTLMFFDNPTALDGGLFGNGIVTKEGIEQTLISAGRSKDLGNPFRRATSEEIAQLQTGVQNEYDNFVQHVASYRDIEQSMIVEQMGAQIFDNQTAQDYGLIDGTLSYHNSVEELAKTAGLETDAYQIVKPRVRSRHLINEILGVSTTPPQLPQAQMLKQACQQLRTLPLVYHGRLHFCAP